MTAMWPQEDILSYLVRRRLLVFAIYTILHIESKFRGKKVACGFLKK